MEIVHNEFYTILSFRKHIVAGIVCIFIAISGFAQKGGAGQSSDAVSDTVNAGYTIQLSHTVQKASGIAAIVQAAPSEYSYQITEVNYNIKGNIRQYPLSQAVPIDTTCVFFSEGALLSYIDDLEKKFINVRAIQSVQIALKYGECSADSIVPVTLTIAVTASWNFIVVPYPSFDSNSGFQVKLKLQDFNFVGTLQPLKANIVYQATKTGHTIFSSSVNFALPFKIRMFNVMWRNSVDIVYAPKEVPKISLTSGLEASVAVNKRMSVTFGFSPELMINDRTSREAASALNNTSFLQQGMHGTVQTGLNTAEDTERRPLRVLGHLYPRDRYYFKTTYYVRSPITITEMNRFGALVWTPSLSITGNAAFDGIQAEELKSWVFGWGHTLSLSHVDWVLNFRKGLALSVSNTYAYRFYRKQEMNIGFTTAVAGYYPFINRVGIYGRMQFFYRLFGKTSTEAGDALRGILNKRVDTDTAFAFNLDIPIRLISLDFQAITGVDWTRFFNCDIQLVPFFDMALTHDKKTKRYYHLADGWYAGGMEVLVYPEKMRSIYIRASLGIDLSELKNLSGRKGRATRDGQSITEIFIGIGVHY